MASFPGNTPGITANNFPRQVVRLVDYIPGGSRRNRIFSQHIAKLNQQPHPIINQSILKPSGASVLAQSANQVINQRMGGGAENTVAPGDDVQPCQVATFLQRQRLQPSGKLR